MRIEAASFDDDAWDTGSFREYLADPQALFLLARQAGRTVGYAVAVFRASRADLDSIAVVPGARGTGIASRLIESLFRRLRCKGVERVSLMVRQENKAAIALYRKHGFDRIRRVPAYYEDGASGWRMGRSILRS